MNTPTIRNFRHATANFFAIAIGSVLLVPVASYAAINAAVTAPSCVVEHVTRHYGPPGKGFDRIVEATTCNGVEIATFNLTAMECSASTLRRVGPRDTVIIRSPAVMKCEGTVAGMADNR